MEPLPTTTRSPFTFVDHVTVPLTTPGVTVPDTVEDVVFEGNKDKGEFGKTIINKQPPYCAKTKDSTVSFLSCVN